MVDFNVDVEATANNTGQYFVPTMATMRLSQLISGPSRQAGHSLDLVVCPDQMNAKC